MKQTQKIERERLKEIGVERGEIKKPNHTYYANPREKALSECESKILQ